MVCCCLLFKEVMKSLNLSYLLFSVVFVSSNWRYTHTHFDTQNQSSKYCCFHLNKNFHQTHFVTFANANWRDNRAVFLQHFFCCCDDDEWSVCLLFHLQVCDLKKTSKRSIISNALNRFVAGRAWQTRPKLLRYVRTWKYFLDHAILYVR